MGNQSPTLAIRGKDGRVARLSRDVLLSRIVTGGVAEGAVVQDAPEGPWKSLATWYLDNSEIHGRPAPDEVAYIRRHVAGTLEPIALRRGLGFADDADQIAGLSPAQVMRLPLDMPTWANVVDVAEVIDQEIAVPTRSLHERGAFDTDLEVPAWGRPFALHADAALIIPPWQDPETAVFSPPALQHQDWQRVAADGAGGRARRRQPIAPPPAPRAARRAPPRRAPRREAPRREAPARARRAPEAVTPPPRTRRAPSAAPPPPPARARRSTVVVTPPPTAPVVNRPEAPAVAAVAAVGGDEMIVETKGWGLFGCVGQLVALAALSFVMLVAVQLGLEAFVASDVAVQLSDKDTDVAARGRSLRAKLIELGPTQAPLVAVLALDPSSPRTAQMLRDTLAVLKPGERLAGLGGSGQVRLVVLPAGRSVGAVDTAALMLTLFRRGLLLEQLNAHTSGQIDAKGLLAGVAPALRRTLKREADSAAVRLQARTFATMAAALKMKAPQLLLNGVRVHENGLKSRATLKEMVAIAVEATNAGIAAVGGDRAASQDRYWKIALTPYKPAVRRRFLAWLVRRERLPSAPATVTDTQRSHALPGKKLAGKKRVGRKSRKSGSKKAADHAQRRGKPAAHVTFQIPAHAPRLGPDSAAVKVVYFADLQCPFCRRLAPRLKRLRKDFGDDVQLIFLHYPLVKLHPEAVKLAKLAIAAHKQGGFWPLHDHLYRAPKSSLAEASTLLWLASETHAKGLNMKKFEADRSGGDDILKADHALGRRLRIRGTPTTFINGWRVNGAVPYTTLRKLVERELSRGQ